MTDPCMLRGVIATITSEYELTDDVYVSVQLVAVPQILKLLEEGRMTIYRHLETFGNVRCFQLSVFD